MCGIANWYPSQIITDRKSRFQARHAEISGPDDVETVLGQFVAEHRSVIKNASHPHILAWRTGTPITKEGSSTPTYTNVQQGFKDNGERGAGAKLLDHLVARNVINKLVIVTRWYGGSPIGLLRFRHIANCSFDSLRQAEKGP